MSILKVNLFQQTLRGRISSIILIFAILNLNSCKLYTSSETNLEYARNSEQILNNLDTYKFYVHDDFNSYLLSNTSFDANGSISGNITLTNYEKPDSTLSKKELREYWQDHKYDINIYTKTNLSTLSADLNDVTNLNSKQQVTITGEMIERMTITSINMEKELSNAAKVLLIILGVLVTLVILVLVITAAAVASAEGAESSSDGSSDGSNSGSNSGSGGSNSGSSG